MEIFLEAKMKSIPRVPAWPVAQEGQCDKEGGGSSYVRPVLELSTSDSQSRRSPQHSKGDYFCFFKLWDSSECFSYNLPPPQRDPPSWRLWL